MIVWFHMLVFAFQDISSSFGVNDVKLITAQAVEAILDAGDASVCLSPPNSANFSLLCTLPGPG